MMLIPTHLFSHRNHELAWIFWAFAAKNMHNFLYTFQSILEGGLKRVFSVKELLEIRVYFFSSLTK